jgi:hypothetical protein
MSLALAEEPMNMVDMKARNINEMLRTGLPQVIERLTGFLILRQQRGFRKKAGKHRP